jgi:hypothetical protein
MKFNILKLFTTVTLTYARMVNVQHFENFIVCGGTKFHSSMLSTVTANLRSFRPFIELTSADKTDNPQLYTPPTCHQVAFNKDISLTFTNIT